MTCVWCKINYVRGQLKRKMGKKLVQKGIRSKLKNKVEIKPRFI
jgi:hypothetical protein